MDQVQCHTAASLPSSLDAGSKQQKEKVMRIFKNDLTHYFLREHDQLPDAYLRSCNKFFKELSDKQQAASVKPQALKNKLHKPGTRVKNRFNRKV
jgi:inorganic pyrophosphatase